MVAPSAFCVRHEDDHNGRPYRMPRPLQIARPERLELFKQKSTRKELLRKVAAASRPSIDRAAGALRDTWFTMKRACIKQKISP